MQLPGAPLALRTGTFLVQGLFFSPASHGGTCHPQSLEQRAGGATLIDQALRWRKAFALTLQWALALLCPLGTWSQTLMVTFAASTWHNGRKSLGRGLAGADTAPEGPLHVVVVSLSKDGKGREAVPSSVVCIKGFIFFSQGLTNRQRGNQLSYAGLKSGVPGTGWEQQCLSCERPVETCISNQGKFMLEPAQHVELLSNSWVL